MLRTVLTVLLTVATLCLATLGLDWIEVGQGLHPAIAFPMATICAMALAFILYLSIDDADSLEESTCSRYTSNDAINKG